MPRRAARRPRVETLITDLDHTLFDWTRSFAEGIRRLTSELRRSGVDGDAVRHHLQAIFKRRQTMEPPSLIAELADSLRPAPAWAVLARGADAYRRGWRSECHAFPGVADTLRQIRRQGCRVVGYTESPAAATAARLELIGLTDAFDAVVCSTDVAANRDARLATERAAPASRARMLTARWWPKGRPDALQQMLDVVAPCADACACVGDHIEKDVAPAAALELPVAWARYGTARRAADQVVVDALRHWPDAAPAAHARGTAVDQPALSGFSDLLATFEFGGRFRHRAI